LALYRDALGDNHRATAEVHVELARAQLAAGHSEAALAAVDRALEIYASIDPDDELHTKLRKQATELRSRVQEQLAGDD
jgi:ribosome-associated translation inhibitor RaiA